MDERLAAAKERAWREVAAIDAAHARGEIDDAGWHRAMAELVAPAYLGAADVRGGSGHTGSADDWDRSRGIVAEAIDRSGTFLDVGSANGLLMESVVTWAAAGRVHDRALWPAHLPRTGRHRAPATPPLGRSRLHR
jgi:hypothetical protein